MAMYLQDGSKPEFRQAAIEHWHRSLEIQPDQPKIRNLIAKYRVPADQASAVLMESPRK